MIDCDIGEIVLMMPMFGSSILRMNRKESNHTHIV